MQNQKLSKSLLELSDALENLALAIAQQKKRDNFVHIKEFSLLAKKFKETTQSLQLDGGNLESQIKAKHQKGFLQEWLQQKNIYTGKSIDTLLVDKKLGDIADFLAEHYNLLSDFYNKLKRQQNLRKDFKTKTKKQSIKYIRKWCNMLHKNKIIDAFHFLDEQTIDVDIAEIHKATYFINGYWLELLLRREIAQILRKNIAKIQNFDILAQVEYIKTDRNNSEIDLLLMINQNVYWFECKSGNIGKYYYRYNDFRKKIQLDHNKAFLVVPAFQMHQAKAAMKNSGMTLLYATDLEDQLPKIFFKK